MEIGTTARLAQADPILAKIIATIPEPRTESTKDVFFGLILLYTLERPDVFPYDDFHLKQ